MTDNKSLEDETANLYRDSHNESRVATEWPDVFATKVLELFERERAKDLKKLSYHSGIPLEDLEGFLRAKESIRKTFGMDITVDEKVPENGIRFDHPDGRSEGVKTNGY